MKLSRSRRAVLAGGAAVILGGAAVGVAGAQRTPVASEVEVGFNAAAPLASEEDVLFYAAAPVDAHEHHQKYMEAVAEKLGITREKLEEAFAEVSKDLGLMGPMFPPMVTTAPVAAVRINLGGEHAVIARTIGISEQQLREEWRGKSLADVARAHNVAPASVVQAIVSHRRAKIDEAAKAGGMPAQMLERMKQNLEREAERFVNEVVGNGHVMIIREFRHEVQRP